MDWQSNMFFYKMYLYGSQDSGQGSGHQRYCISTNSIWLRCWGLGSVTLLCCAIWLCSVHCILSCCQKVTNWLISLKTRTYFLWFDMKTRKLWANVIICTRIQNKRLMSGPRKITSWKLVWNSFNPIVPS